MINQTRFQPRKELGDDQGLDLETQFQFNPKKFYCTKHSKNEVLYCCELNEKFYCARCLPDHKDHNDKALHEICHSMQTQLINLRTIYFSKKKVLSTKVNTHLDKIEQVFQIYYETLDDLRSKLLKEEYEYLSKMNSLETRLKSLVGNLKRYSVMDFYHEEADLKLQMNEFKDDLDSFNIYLPGSVL